MKSAKMRKVGIFSTLLALSSHNALAAQECAPQADVSDAMIYAMPHAMDALTIACGETLPASGFLNNGGAAEMRAGFAERQDEAWPGAIRLIERFASKGRSSEMWETLRNLPDESIRPFIDAIIVQKLAEEIPTKECGNIERGLALMAPLPPENIGGLAAFLFDMADVKNPKVCPYEPSE
jgi:hypothetical protein